MTQRDDDPELDEAEDVLGAFNAEEVVDEPGQPPKQEGEGSPADEADAPAP